MNRSATPGPPAPDRRGADYLTRILDRKRREVAALRSREGELRRRAVDAPPARPWDGALRPPGRVALIAEIKRRAPSAGALRTDLVAEELARLYEGAGAAALSVLTDADFDGELSDLQRARAAVSVPALRKDFVLEPVQIWEARAAGADAVLLIVRALGEARLRELLAVAAAAGMGTLTEVHDADELALALEVGAPVIGVNNRDLRTFATTLEVTAGLAAAVPADRILVSESGIESAEDVRVLGSLGVDAVLVGRALVTHGDPAALAAQLAGQARSARS